MLSRHNPGLQLLQRVRDEAHRFALGFHRQRRDARGFASIFDDLEGVGPAQAPGAAPALRLGRADARRDRRGARGRPRRAVEDGAPHLRPAAQGRPELTATWRSYAQSGPGEALRLIRDRNFGPYFVGNASSASGTWFQNLAASLLVYRLTHSAFLLGVLNFCNFIPVLLLAPWAGSAADRFDRKRLLLDDAARVDRASAPASQCLPWTGYAPVWVVIVCAVVLGIGSAFAAPASQALIGDLVPREQLGSAVALNSMTYNLARAVGPALAAVSVSTLGIPASFAINSARTSCSCVGLLIVHPAPRRLASRGEARLRESLRLVRGQPRLLAYLLIVAAVGFASDPVNTESPAFADAFGRPDTDAGYLIGAFGVGAVLAAFLVAGRVSGLAPAHDRHALPARRRDDRLLARAVARARRISSSSSPASATSRRTRRRRAGCCSTSTTTSGGGSWRSGASRSSASVRSRACSTARSPAPFGVRAAGVVLALPVLAIAGVIYFLQRAHRTIT